MKLILSITAALSVLSGGLLLAEEVRPFQRMDVFELEWVSDPQMSPDGRRVVYIRNAMDIMRDGKTARLWLVGSDGAGNVPLTGRDVNESSPRWSPDGSRIVYTSTSEKEKGAEIFGNRGSL